MQLEQQQKQSMLQKLVVWLNLNLDIRVILIIYLIGAATGMTYLQVLKSKRPIPTATAIHHDKTK